MKRTRDKLLFVSLETHTSFQVARPLATGLAGDKMRAHSTLFDE